MSLSSNLSFGLGLKLALDGFNGLRTQHATSRYENIFSWRVAKDKELGKIAKLSTDKMNNLTKSINKLNRLDIKAGLAKEKLKALKRFGQNIAKLKYLMLLLK